MPIIQAKGSQSQQEPPLPLLRQDIKLYRGPDEADGSPTYNLYDPVRAQYFKISWTEATILQQLRPGITLPELTKAVNRVATFQVTEEEIKNFFIDASRNNLLASRKASEDVLKEAELKKRNIFTWFIYHYLYFRVPLISPDKFLTKTIRYVEPLASSYAVFIYLAITIAGLLMLVGRFDEFIHTFPYFFNFEGAVIYAVAISCVKVIHEFSHAYVAKHYRLHVPTMGAAFIVMWPVLYTDVTDGWKLSKRSERLAISFAGIAAEMTIAGMCTLGWALTEPGMLQSVFFVVSSATWISTLAVNLNPAMRFDGYYLMCDLSGIDNLQMRAFAFTRWQLRKWFLGLDVPAPEELITPKRRLGMMVYTIYTWIYRLFLYTTIAVFVYYQFTKALGILLFFVEIVVFLIAPFYSEARQLKTLYPYLKVNPRLIATVSALSLLLIWFVMPLPHEERFVGITIPKQDQTVYIPFSGIVKEIYVKLDDQVNLDQPLLQLNSPELDLSIEEKKADGEVVIAQLHVIALNETDKAFLPEKQAELALIDAKLQGLLELKKTLTIKAKIQGTVYNWDDSLHIDQAVAKNDVVGKIAALNQMEVICFIPEANLHDFEVGKEVKFQLRSNFEELTGTIREVRDARAIALQYPQLASINQGELPVTEEPQNKLVLVESYFAVLVDLDKHDIPLRIGQKGFVIFEGPWKSHLMSLWDRASSIFWRESGL